MSTVDRKVKQIEIYAETDDANSLKIDELKFQENTVPKEKNQAVIPLPYYGYDIDLDEWMLNQGLEDAYVLTLDPTEPSGFSWRSGSVLKHAMVIQMYVWYELYAGDDQVPTTIIPSSCTAVSIVGYCKTAGTATIRICCNGASIGTVVVTTGVASTSISVALAAGDLITLDVVSADGVAADLTCQLRCI